MRTRLVQRVQTRRAQRARSDDAAREAIGDGHVL